MQTSELMSIVAASNVFRQRLAYLLAAQAWIVRIEAPETANHAERNALALTIQASPQAYAGNFAIVFAGRPAVLGGGVDTTTDPGNPFSQAEDGSLQGQLATDWNVMAGL